MNHLDQTRRLSPDLIPLLAGRAEEAVLGGSQLAAWCRQADYGQLAFPLQLHRPFRLANRAEGYFGEAAINGAQTSVMGCRQTVSFGARQRAEACDVVEFMTSEFLRAARWSGPKGQLGGFTVTPELGKDQAGTVARFSQPTFEWTSLGADWDWVLLRIELHDFVMRFGPLERRIPQAALVAPSSAFFEIVNRPAGRPDLELSVTIGYPFVRFAPYRNVFGFGPGKFTTAIKVFTMHLRHDGQVEMDMNFAAAPRCQKVLDFGPHWPDPVYGAASIAERLTGGLWKSQPFRNRLDAAMLAQHCRVHLSLIEGVEHAWRRWLESRVLQGVGRS